MTRYWQVALTLHQRPGSPVIVVGVDGESSSQAYGTVLRRLGPRVYGADVRVSEIPPPQERGKL